MRPRKIDYDRFLALVYFGREHNWDAETIARRGPFWVADPGNTFILLRADRDLLTLARRLRDSAAVQEISGWINRAENGVEKLWNTDLQAYCARDLRSDSLSSGLSSASMLAFYAGLGGDDRARQLTAHLQRICRVVKYAMPSFDPEHEGFDAMRYWRGPVWAVVNFMIGEGLAESGHDELAQRIRGDTLALIESAGFQEYFNPMSGEGAGGGAFSWTAAIWLALAGGD